MPAGEKNAVGLLYTRITRPRRAFLPVRACGNCYHPRRGSKLPSLHGRPI
jgi:hypothetical protein